MISIIGVIGLSTTNDHADITELSPFDENTVFLKVFDGGSMATGVISHFSVEVYDNHPSGSPFRYSLLSRLRRILSERSSACSINDVSVLLPYKHWFLLCIFRTLTSSWK